MQDCSSKPSSEEMVRARVDAALKKQWEDWCARVNVTPSQALRWLIHMHLADPSKLWNYLAQQDQPESGTNVTSEGKDVAN